MSSLEDLIRARAEAGELKSLNLIKSPTSGKYQASLDYGTGAYAVHVDPDPIVAAKYVLAMTLDLRLEIARKNNRDGPAGVYVPVFQHSCGKEVEKRSTHVPKGSAHETLIPLAEIDEDELLS